MAQEEQQQQEITAAQELISTFLEKLSVSADVETSIHEDQADFSLDTEDSGMLIGYHGEILESLQLILSLALTRKFGRFVRVSIEIGDYKKNRSEYLTNLAQQIKEKVLQENREYTLSNLKAWERRIVHMHLQDDKDVISESIGEGRDRVLVIKPR